MSRIRSRDTLPELALRRGLHALGLRYRLNDKNLPGKPDLVFPRYRTVIFVHGCFWHRHEGCSIATTPKSNVEFWGSKFEANVARDQRAEQNLSEAGWRVIKVWECELKSRSKALATAEQVARKVRALGAGAASTSGNEAGS